MSDTKITTVDIANKKKEIRDFCFEVAAQPQYLNVDEARELVDELTDLYDGLQSSIKVALAAIGLQHELYISIGDYGTGEMLILEENHWSGIDRGDWLPSSESC